MAVEVPARVGKGIIKAIKPSGVGVAVPPPSVYSFLFIYLFIYLFISPFLFTNKIKTSEPHQKTADFQLQATTTPTPQKTHLYHQNSTKQQHIYIYIYKVIFKLFFCLEKNIKLIFLDIF